MSDEFAIIDDDDEQTMVLDDDEVEVDDDDIEVEGDDDLDDLVSEYEDEDEDIRPPAYRPDSNVYSVMLVLSFIAYAAALALILREMEPYCIIDRFMWGLFKQQ